MQAKNANKIILFEEYVDFSFILRRFDLSVFFRVSVAVIRSLVQAFQFASTKFIKASFALIYLLSAYVSVIY